MESFVVTFLNLEMADGRSVLVTMEVDSAYPQGLCELRDFLLSRPGLCFRASSGGVSILNLANLCSLTIFPGAHQPPDGAWQVRRLDERQPTSPEDSLIAEVAAGPRPSSISIPNSARRSKLLHHVAHERRVGADLVARPRRLGGGGRGGG